MIEDKESLQKSYNMFFDELPEDVKEVHQKTYYNFSAKILYLQS